MRARPTHARSRTSEDEGQTRPGERALTSSTATPVAHRPAGVELIALPVSPPEVCAGQCGRRLPLATLIQTPDGRRICPEEVGEALDLASKHQTLLASSDSTP
jgi:hypothetical protein